MTLILQASDSRGKVTHFAHSFCHVLPLHLCRHYNAAVQEMLQYLPHETTVHGTVDESPISVGYPYYVQRTTVHCTVDESPQCVGLEFYERWTAVHCAVDCSPSRFGQLGGLRKEQVTNERYRVSVLSVVRKYRQHQAPKSPWRVRLIRRMAFARNELVRR